MYDDDDDFNEAFALFLFDLVVDLMEDELPFYKRFKELSEQGYGSHRDGKPDIFDKMVEEGYTDCPCDNPNCKMGKMIRYAASPVGRFRARFHPKKE